MAATDVVVAGGVEAPGLGSGGGVGSSLLRTMDLKVPVAAVHSALGVGWTKNWLTSASALNSSASSGMASSSSSRFNSIGKEGGAGGGGSADAGGGAGGAAVARAKGCAGAGVDAWGVGASACMGAVEGARGGDCAGAGMDATGVGRGAVVAAGCWAGRGPALYGALPFGADPLVPAGGRDGCVGPAACWGGRGADAGVSAGLG